MTDAELGFIDDGKWRFDVRIGSDTFDGIKSAMARVVERVNEARSYKDISSFGWVSGSEDGPLIERVDARLRCSVEAEISRLRAEADALEAGLKAKP